MRAGILILALTALVWSAGTVARLRHYDFEPTALVGFGCVRAGPCFAAANRALLPARTIQYDGGGYDGQFFYYIAASLGRRLDWILVGQGPAPPFPPQLDSAPFRLARIGFPVLVVPWALFGPEALLWGMLGTMLALHLLAVGLILRRLQGDGHPLGPVWVLALNPFSLYSFVLVTADGTALALCVIGLRLFSNRRLLALVCFAAAVLCKETMLSIPAAIGGAAMWNALSPGWSRRNSGELRRALVLLVVPACAAAWWWWVGFSPIGAAERGSAPFIGVAMYLADSPDALLSPRSLLVAILLVFAVGAVFAVWEAIGSPKTALRERACLLVLALVPASMAAHPEYWGTYANVMRLFTPFVAVFALPPDSGDGSRAGRGRGRVRTIRLAGVLFFALSFLQTVREWTSRGLPSRPSPAPIARGRHE